jgi:hypothetical protein
MSDTSFKENICKRKGERNEEKRQIALSGQWHCLCLFIDFFVRIICRNGYNDKGAA